MDKLHSLFQEAKNSRASLILNNEEHIHITAEDVELCREQLGCGQCNAPPVDILYVMGKVTAPYLGGIFSYQANIAKHYACWCGNSEHYEEDQFLFKGNIDHPTKPICHYFIKTGELTSTCSRS